MAHVSRGCPVELRQTLAAVLEDHPPDHHVGTGGLEQGTRALMALPLVFLATALLGRDQAIEPERRDTVEFIQRLVYELLLLMPVVTLEVSQGNVELSRSRYRQWFLGELRNQGLDTWQLTDMVPLPPDASASET